MASLSRRNGLFRFSLWLFLKLLVAFVFALLFHVVLVLVVVVDPESSSCLNLQSLPNLQLLPFFQNLHIGLFSGAAP